MFTVMNKLLLTLFSVLALVSCEKDSEPLPAPSIEGRWLWAPSSSSSANTMYEYLDGIRYTYYGSGAESTLEYWQSLDTSDALPGTNPYTFENDILTVDLHFGNIHVTPVVFECDGGKVYFEEPGYYLVRLGSDCN